MTAEGFFLPCCWCDRRNQYFEERGFLDVTLNISEVDDIVTEVFQSKPWVDFFYEVQYGDDYPNVCEEHCGINSITNIKVQDEPI